METPDTIRSKRMFQVTDFLDQPYKLDRNKHYEDFLCELGVGRSTRAQAFDSKPTVKLSNVDGVYILCTNYPEGRIVKVKFKPGERMQRQRLIESPTSSVFYVIENQVREEQYVDNKYVIVEWEFKPKELVQTLTLNSVKCYRWYKAVVSDSIPSFATETSRRISTWDAETPESENDGSSILEDDDSSFEIFRPCR